MYVPLNLKTVYANSLIEVSDLFNKAVREGMQKIAINDGGMLHHYLEVGKLVKETGVEAVIGATFPFLINSRTVSLTLYPKTQKGKKFLQKLSSTYSKNNQSTFLLTKMKSIFNEMNVIIDSKGFESENLKAFIRILSKEYVQRNSLFVGLHETFNQRYKSRNLHIEKVLLEERVGYVAFNPILFLEEEQFETYQYYAGIKENEVPEDIENVFLYQEDIEDMFSYLSLIEQTFMIMENTMVSYSLEKSGIKIPTFVPEEKFVVHPLFYKRFGNFVRDNSEEEVTSAAYLFHLVMNGIITNYGKDKVAVERALYELELIINKKFSDYFLIVNDFIDYLKKDNHVLGPGRGSVVASIVANSLGITRVNPLENNLQFERFLNRYREDYPDMDIDMLDDTRVVLVAYLKKKYGEKHVAQIMTRTNYGFNNAMSALVKKMIVPKEKIEKIISYGPNNYESFKEFLLNAGDECLEFVNSSKDVEKLLYHTFAIKGLPQNTSKHASGFIISKEPLDDEIPMMYDNGVAVTQVTNKDGILEKVGLLKFDLLIVTSLGITEETKTAIGLKELPENYTNDVKAIEVFAKGQTAGIFQFEAASRFCGEWMTSFEDVVALNALNRPGPMAQIPVFVEQKGKPVSLFDDKGNELKDVECLYPILEATNGIILYQEQINLIAHVWAGYHLSKAEAFRRGISKKDETVLLDQREIFLKKALENNRDEYTSRQIYKLILKFSDFGINKAHAVGYAQIAMEMAYLKGNFPLEFMTSLLNSVSTKTKKSAEYIQETRSMGIDVLAIDINESTEFFVVEGKAIRPGFAMIKDIGTKTAKAICEARGNARFRDIQDVINRIQNVGGVDFRHLENLIRVGALDSLGERGEMLNTLGIKTNCPMNMGEKVLNEIEYCETIFSFDKTLQDKLAEKFSEKENTISGIVKKVDVLKDKYDKDYAKLEITKFNGKNGYFIIFSSDWRKVGEQVKKGSILVSDVDKKILKNVKILNF